MMMEHNLQQSIPCLVLDIFFVSHGKNWGITLMMRVNVLTNDVYMSLLLNWNYVDDDDGCLASRSVVYPAYHEFH